MRLPLGNGSAEERPPTSRSFLDRGVGSSILASLSEAGGNALHKPTREPLPPRAPEFAGRHLECAHAGHPASLRPSSFASRERWIPFVTNKLWVDPLMHIRDATCPALNSGVPCPNVE